MRLLQLCNIKGGQVSITALFLLLLFGIMLSGCAKTPEQPRGSEAIKKPLASAQPEEKDGRVVLYFADDEAMYLTPELREIKLEAGRTLPQAILSELIKGPLESGHFSTLPKTTQLLSLEVRQGIAYVNLSSQFEQDYPGGTTGEFMALGSIIRSLTELPSINAVQFLIEGKRVEVLAKGHVDLSNPAERAVTLGILEQIPAKVEAEQQAADQGQKSWRLDPLKAARIEGPLHGLYVNGDYKLISKTEKGAGSGTGEALIRHEYKGTAYDIWLIQPVKTGSAGIWVINSIMPYASMDEAIQSFLEKHFIQPSFGGRIFSSYEILGERDRDGRKFIYIWALCEEYYQEGGALKEGGGVSIPISLILFSQDEQHNGIIQFQVPGDGTNYGIDLKEIFPTDVQQKIAVRQSNVKDLQYKNLVKAQQHFK